MWLWLWSKCHGMTKLSEEVCSNEGTQAVGQTIKRTWCLLTSPSPPLPPSPPHTYCLHIPINLITWKHAWTEKLWVYSSYMSTCQCMHFAVSRLFITSKTKKWKREDLGIMTSLTLSFHPFTPSQSPLLSSALFSTFHNLPSSLPFLNPSLPYSLLPQISSALLYSGRLLLSALGQRCVSAAGQDRRVYEWRALSFRCEETLGWGGRKGRLCVWHVRACVCAGSKLCK